MKGPGFVPTIFPRNWRIKAVAVLSPLGPTLGAVADVCDLSSVEAMVSRVVEVFGRLDILINNAGANASIRRTAEIDGPSWDKGARLTSTSRGPSSAARLPSDNLESREAAGRSSTSPALAGRWLGSLAGCHYTAAKAGVIGLTPHLADQSSVLRESA